MKTFSDFLEEKLKDPALGKEYEKLESEFSAVQNSLIIPQGELPYTEDELLTMHAQPAWCKETNCWGLVCVESGGRWKDVPFFVFLDTEYATSAKFTYNVKERNLTLYRQPV